MTTALDTVRAATLAALRGQVKAADDDLTARRNARAAAIGRRVDNASPGPWSIVDRRGDRHNAQIEIHRPGDHAFTRVANVMRRGRNPVADANLIGHARTDLQWLLDEVARLTAERDLLLAAADQATTITYYSHRAYARLAETHGPHRTAA